MFNGVCPVVNVPFNEDYSIDFKGLEKIVNYIIDEDIKSCCLFAFNSEPYKLSFEEKKETIKKFISYANGKIETLVGIVENSETDCIELGKCAKESGADGIILYPPALSTPQGDALVDYFKTIAEAVDVPVMIQDNPRSTGVNMSIEMLINAFENIKQFEFIKVECPIPMRKMKRLIDVSDGKLKCYSGNGGIFAVEAFLNGASGIMPGVALCGYFNRMYKSFENGDIDNARNMFEKILPLAWFEDQSLEFYISCEKYILKDMGIIECDAVRKPCTELTDDEKAELMILYERIK